MAANFDYFIRLRSHDAISGTIAKVNKALGKAKTSANGFVKALKTPKLKGFNNAITDMGARAKAQADNMFKVAASFTAVGLAIATPIKASIDFEDSMADVKKVVGGTNKEFKILKEQVFTLSKTIPLLPKELNAIVAAGGRLGIPKDQLIGFTATVAKASVAFDMSAEQAGTAFANLANRLSIPISRVGDLGDAINHLSDTTASTAPAIIEVMGRISGTLSQLKIPPHLGAGMAAFADQVFVSQELAASGLQQMVSAFAKTNKKFGLFTKIQKEGVGGIKDFLGKASKLSQIDLTNMFGTEAARAIGLMASKTKLLSKTMGQVADKTKFAGSMQREFEARSATTSNQIKLMKNSLNRMAITIGDAVLPLINQVLRDVSPLIESFRAWAKENQEVIKQVLIGAVALAGLVGAVLAAKLAIFPLVYALTAVKIAITAVTVVYKAFKFLLMANPFVRLIAVIILIVGYFAGFDNIVKAITTTISFLWDKFKGFIDFLTNKFPLVGKIINTFKSIIGKVSGALGFGDSTVKIQVEKIKEVEKAKSEALKIQTEQKQIVEQATQPIETTTRNLSNVNVNLQAKDLNITGIETNTKGNSLNLGVNSLGSM